MASPCPSDGHCPFPNARYHPITPTLYARRLQPMLYPPNLGASPSVASDSAKMPLFTVRSPVAGLVSILNDDEHARDAIAAAREQAVKTLSKRRLMCLTCRKSFTTSAHLTRHYAMHTGERPFVCPYPKCMKRTSRQDNLVQHYRMHLPKQLPRQTHSYVRGCMEELFARTEAKNRRWIRGERESKTGNGRTGPPVPTLPAALRGPCPTNIKTRPSLPAIPQEELSPTLTYMTSGTSMPSSPSRYLNTPFTMEFRNDPFNPTRPFTPPKPMEPPGYGWAVTNDRSRYAASHVRSG